MLETVDEHLLRALVKGQSKTPLEFLYLEAGATPIRYLITCRRLLYHQVILQRDDSELTRRVYIAQKNDPTPGDFVDLLYKDFKSIKVVQNDDAIQTMDKHTYKQRIKSKVKEAAFLYLKEKQQQHSKVRDLNYDQLKTQCYMTSPLFSNEEVNMLHALRSRSTDCKNNFKQKYINSNILCTLCQLEDEDQQHVLRCTIIQSKFKSEDVISETPEYEYLFSDDVQKQKRITALFLALFKIKEDIHRENQFSREAPSNTEVMLDLGDNVHNSIVHSNLGK